MPDRAVALVGGRVLTMDGAEAEAVVFVGDRVAAVGPRAVLGAFGEPEIHDVTGHTVVPGLIDAHHHFSSTALLPRLADVSDVDDLADLAEALHRQARDEPDAPWIRGEGWRRPVRVTAADLDELELDRPVILAHFSIHQCVVDSRGLDALGISATTPDPPGGRIGRDDRGRPDGLLVERAWSEAHAVSLAAYTDPDRWGELIVDRAVALLRDGVTAVHDAACTPAAEAVYATLARRRELPISVLGLVHPAALLSGPDPARLDGPVTGEGDEWFRVGPVKLFADGGVSMGVDAHREGVRRQVGTSFPDVVDGAALAASRGFGVAIHSMGNAGLALALAAFERAGVRGAPPTPFRVEHLALARPDQLDRLAALDVVGVVQPGFVPMLGPQVAHAIFEDADWLPFATALDRGIVVAASTDAPCADRHPLHATCHGVTRVLDDGRELGTEESVDYPTWLHAWTAAAARAGGQEDERGRLRVGLRADAVVLAGELDPRRPPRVEQTWVGGRRVHEASP